MNSFRSGQPEILHYDSDQNRTKARRKEALKNYPSRYSEGLERDEYPYASTNEGGAGSNIAYVPSRENSSQGGSLRALYSKLKSGDPFLVLPVPKDREPETVPEPIPVLPPIFKPSPSARPAPTGIPILDRVFSLPIFYLPIFNPPSWLQSEEKPRG